MPDASGYYRDAPARLTNAECEWDEVSPGLRALISEAADRDRWPVYLFGATGRGKTSAAAALYRRWSGSTVSWIRLCEFVRLIQRCERDGPQLYGGSHSAFGAAHWIESRIERPSLLVVDDIGLRGVTEPQYEIIFDIIDRRGTRPTIYTGNLSLAEIEKLYDGRISSRLIRGTNIELTGPDRRFNDVKIAKA